MPNTFLIVLALVLVYFGVSRALSPLTRLSDTITHRSGVDVAPLETEAVDREVLPLVDALNRLMSGLAAAATAQRQFLGNAAHQLRTPLAGLQTQIELVAQDLAPHDRERVAALAVAARRVGHLSQQLLAHARSSPEAAIGHELEDFDLADLIEERASGWFDEARTSDADIGFELAPARIHGSPWLIGEMLTNLIDNAVKHGGPTVTVRCGRRPAGVVVEVEDDGPGIAEAERNEIFDRFRRGRGATSPGTGLGLAIVREVAKRHGAHIEVVSGAEGRGALFRLTFPVSKT